MKLIFSLLIPLAIGTISGLFTAEGVNGWYKTLAKPTFNPPNWLFAPVWTLLYILMGISLWEIWKLPTATPNRSTALWLFGIQIFLNFCWSFIFFKLQSPAWALVEIVFLWLIIFVTIIFFAKIKPLAGWLQVPYIVWVSFATILNFYIWKLN